MKETPSRLKIVAAFAIVYIVWGSTYLGIKLGLESLPPFLMSGIRFAIAGLILWIWCAIRKEPLPSRRQVVNASIVGLLLVLIGNGTVTWAEKSLSSGMVALLVGVQPVWMVLVMWASGEAKRPSGTTVIGLILGLFGVGTLAASGGDLKASLFAATLVVLGALSWSIGSLRSQVAEMPASTLRSNAVQMFVAGFALSLVGMGRGEIAALRTAHATTTSLLAVAYLIVFGSIVAYSAYAWLLQHVSATAASTCAYVNPAIAVALGWAWGEPVGKAELFAMAMIFAAVAILGRSTRVKKPAVSEPVTVPITLPAAAYQGAE